MLKQLGDISAASGQSLEDMAITYSRVKTQGLYATEANMFGDKGIAIYDYLASRGEGNGPITVQEVKKKMEKGQYDVGYLDEMLDSMTGVGGIFEGATDKLAGTLNGLNSTLGDTISVALQDFGAGFLDESKQAVVNLTETLQKMLPTIAMLGRGLGALATAATTKVLGVSALDAAGWMAGNAAMGAAALPVRLFGGRAWETAKAAKNLMTEHVEPEQNWVGYVDPDDTDARFKLGYDQPWDGQEAQKTIKQQRAEDRAAARQAAAEKAGAAEALIVAERHALVAAQDQEAALREQLGDVSGGDYSLGVKKRLGEDMFQAAGHSFNRGGESGAEAAGRLRQSSRMAGAPESIWAPWVAFFESLEAQAQQLSAQQGAAVEQLELRKENQKAQLAADDERYELEQRVGQKKANEMLQVRTRAQELVAGGMSEEQARNRAGLEYGRAAMSQQASPAIESSILRESGAEYGSGGVQRRLGSVHRDIGKQQLASQERSVELQQGMLSTLNKYLPKWGKTRLA